LTGLPVHSTLSLTLDLYVIESWDGNGYGNGSICNGPDIWFVNANGTNLIWTTFESLSCNGTQSYPDNYPNGDYPHNYGATEIGTLGYTGIYGFALDAVYHLSFVFQHSGSSVILSFGAQGLQGISDESWGLD